MIHECNFPYIYMLLVNIDAHRNIILQLVNVLSGAVGEKLRVACLRVGVPIPATTDLSRKNR